MGQKGRLASLLRQLRMEAGLHQAEVARRLDKPQSFVSRYEAAERRLDLIELQAVCAAMGVSLVDFVARFEKGL